VEETVVTELVIQEEDLDDDFDERNGVFFNGSSFAQDLGWHAILSFLSFESCCEEIRLVGLSFVVSLLTVSDEVFLNSADKSAGTSSDELELLKSDKIAAVENVEDFNEVERVL
jgi:hypothetical protein